MTAEDFFAINQPVDGASPCKLSIVSSNTSVDSSSFSSLLSDLPGGKSVLEPEELSAAFSLSVPSNKKQFIYNLIFFLFSGYISYFLSYYFSYFFRVNLIIIKFIIEGN